MTQLTPFQEKVKAVLIKLQYLCDSIASYKPDTKKGIVYSFKDMYPPLKGEEQLQDIVKYLSENGLEISITFPIYNSDPRETIYIKEYGDPDNVPLGLIKGKNIEEIKQVIQKNINKLNNKNLEEIDKKEYQQKKEDIELKTLGIIIKGDYIVYKRMKSEEINPADQEIISFLYHQFIKNREWCFKKEELATELGFSGIYIRNRISKINQKIKKLVASSRTSIGDFILNERKRGYHLSRRFMIQFIKTKKI